jgi:hypothetical protein
MPIINAMNQWGEANRTFLETVIKKEITPVLDEQEMQMRRKVC